MLMLYFFTTKLAKFTHSAIHNNDRSLEAHNNRSLEVVRDQECPAIVHRDTKIHSGKLCLEISSQ